MRGHPLTLMLAALAFAGCATLDDVPPAAADDPVSPYAGEQVRAIKALSAQEVDDLLNGRGMGLAKAAELNTYPGPLHALDLADALGLTQAQRDALTEVRERMLAEAVPLGERIVQAEADLEHAFATGEIDEPGLRALVTRIAQLQGELRVAHLAAHLETKALMTPEQVQRYDELRGYADGDDGASHEGHASHAQHGA